MTEYLPDSVRAQLRDAQSKTLARKSRVRVEAGGQSYAVLRFGKTGFSLDAATAPHLRGLVDLYDGARHVSQCLIVAAEEVDGLMHFEFKRNTATGDGAPLDYERAADAPVGYLTR